MLLFVPNGAVVEVDGGKPASSGLPPAGRQSGVIPWVIPRVIPRGFPGVIPGVIPRGFPGVIPGFFPAVSPAGFPAGLSSEFSGDSPGRFHIKFPISCPAPQNRRRRTAPARGPFAVCPHHRPVRNETQHPSPLLMGLGCVNTEPKALAGGPAAPLLVGLGRVNTEPKALAGDTVALPA